jgi:hypothetical protein
VVATNGGGQEGAPPAEDLDGPSAASEAALGKRRADVIDAGDQPEVKRRNRRLFGALMGTLQKFKEQEERSAGSELAQRRAEVQQAAERRSQEASSLASQEARHGAERRRAAEEARSRQLGLAVDEKWLEVYYARGLARREAEDAYVRTAAQPSLLWKPNVECAAVRERLAAQAEASKAWRRERLALLDGEVAELRERAAAAGVLPLAAGEAGVDEANAAAADDDDDDDTGAGRRGDVDAAMPSPGAAEAAAAVEAQPEEAAEEGEIEEAEEPEDDKDATMQQEELQLECDA